MKKVEYFWDFLFMAIAVGALATIFFTAVGCREPYLPPDDLLVLKEEAKLVERSVWQGVFLDRTYRVVYTLDLNKMMMRIESYDGSSKENDQQRPVTLITKDGKDVIYGFTDEIGKPGFGLDRDALRFRQDGSKATVTTSQGMLVLDMKRI